MPPNEAELSRLVKAAWNRGVVITARGGGSNQSGSAVGDGLILETSKLNAIIELDGNKARAQAGVWHGDLMKRANEQGSMVPYDPSSSLFCTIGGNVATNATGLRGVKYGSVDRWLNSVRLFNPRFGMLDSRENLPEELAQGLSRLRNEFLEDREIIATFKARKGLKSSSGYNLSAILDHEDPGEMLMHLMSGSVGTLGVLTEVGLKLIPAPSHRSLMLALFRGLEEACEAVPGILRYRPSSLELMDAYGTQELAKAGWDLPVEAGASLIIELDENPLSTARSVAEQLVNGAIRTVEIEEPERQSTLWRMRGEMLLRIKRAYEDEQHRFIPFADDLAVPVNRLEPFVKDILHLFEKEGLMVIIYGHVGEGNIHVRPLVPSDEWQERLRRLAKECFRIAFRYGGSMTGEHGMGRNRAPFLVEEFGERTYQAFGELKELFDPEDLLNRGAMLSSTDLTEGLYYKP
jgi:glycolate oxidase